MVQMEMLARSWLGKRQICRGFDSILIYVELKTLSAGKRKGTKFSCFFTLAFLRILHSSRFKGRYPSYLKRKLRCLVNNKGRG